MYKNKIVAVIIPARGGSKRIPKKNIKLLAGKPLLSYSIEHAQKSSLVDHVYVTSDSKEILDVSEKLGAMTIKRPEEISQDDSNTLDAVKHAILQIEKKIKKEINIIVLLQPTTPLRKFHRIDQAIKTLVDMSVDTVIGVFERSVSPEWILAQKDKYAEFALKNNFEKIRSQDNRGYYEINGSIYVYPKSLVMKSEQYAIGNKILPLVMGKTESLDIDEQEDFETAESILLHQNEKY